MLTEILRVKRKDYLIIEGADGVIVYCHELSKAKAKELIKLGIPKYRDDLAEPYSDD